MEKYGFYKQWNIEGYVTVLAEDEDKAQYVVEDMEISQMDYVKTIEEDIVYAAKIEDSEP